MRRASPPGWLLASAVLLWLVAGAPSAGGDPDQYVPRPVTIRPTAATVTGGEDAEFTVTLEGSTEADRAVAISTDQPAVFADLPESVVVPAGYTFVTFSVATCAVSSQVAASITASLCGAEDQTGLLVVP